MFVLDGLNDEVKQRTATIVGLGRVELVEGELDERVRRMARGGLPWGES